MNAKEFAQRPPDEILNQPPPLIGHNLFETDQPLREAVAREGGGWIADRARELGEICGRHETQHWGHLANANPPILHTHDRFGHRIDQVEFHPAWHELMSLSFRFQCHSLPWVEERPGAHAARAALAMVRNQVEEGHGCPVTMTFAVVPSLREQPDLADIWEPRAMSSEYDGRFLPAEEKNGAVFGMAMTERQGGSDVRSNTTRAHAIGAGGPGEAYELTGHKWFCSAPMCDAFLVLARSEGGLSCFLLPRFRPDGTQNAFHIIRLKDKLGNRSNASSEVQFDGAYATMVGEEGRGIATIIEMVRHTRLDCVFGSASSMRKGVAHALHHAMHRYAFGRVLIKQPLMQNVLADLCLESEAATALALRLARSYDEGRDDEDAAAFARLATAIGKYWVTKRNAPLIAEALECLGGNGYVEESGMPRLYRDAPLNSIWEGSGNVQCLDVLRAMQREPRSVAAVRDELAAAAGQNATYDEFISTLEHDLQDTDDIELRARDIVERLAVALQASILIRTGNDAVSAAYCEGRLGSGRGRVFGTLPAGLDLEAVLNRNLPVS